MRLNFRCEFIVYLDVSFSSRVLPSYEYKELKYVDVYIYIYMYIYIHTQICFQFYFCNSNYDSDNGSQGETCFHIV